MINLIEVTDEMIGSSILQRAADYIEVMGQVLSDDDEDAVCILQVLSDCLILEDDHIREELEPFLFHEVKEKRKGKQMKNGIYDWVALDYDGYGCHRIIHIDGNMISMRHYFCFLSTVEESLSSGDLFFPVAIM